MKQEEHELIFAIDLQWFAKDGPGGEKTEPATAKKLREAREDGKVAKSKELTAAFDLIVLFLVMKIFISYVANSLMELFTYFYGMIPDFVQNNAKDLSTQAVSGLFSTVILKIILICAPFFLFGLAITLVISIFQVGWKVTG